MKKLYLVGLFVFAFFLVCGTNANAAVRIEPPSGLVASPVSNTQINLSWADNSDNESGFVVESSLDGVIFNEATQTPSNVIVFSNKNLTPGTTYYYRVRAFRSYGGQTVYSKYSKTADATTAGQVFEKPLAPTNLSATAISYYQIDLAWTDNSSDENGFKIERSLDGVAFYEVAQVGAGIVSYSNINRNPATRYYYRVRAYRMEDLYVVYSDYSNDDDATTFNSPLLPPANPDAKAFSYSQIDLTWQPGADNRDGFVVERSLNGDNFSEIARLGASAVSYSDTGLDPRTRYYYQVRSFRRDGSNTIYSNCARIVNATTLRLPLAAPTNFAVAAVSYSQIDLTWQDNSSDEGGFAVERSSDGVNFSQIAQTATNTIAYSDSGLNPNTAYYYRVRAFLIENGVSYYSSYARIENVVTPSSPLPAPSSLTAVAPSTSYINIFWQDNSSDESGFAVERSSDGVNFSQIAQVEAGTSAYSNTALNSNSTYYYRVRAFKVEGSDAIYSDYSAISSATTMALSIVAPANLAVSTASYAQLDLSWQDNSDNEHGFSIERSLDGTNFFVVGDTSANITTYADTNLVSNTTYYYRVRAKIVENGQSTYSAYSPVSSNKTGVFSSITPPAGLNISFKSYYQIYLTWQDNSDNETGFIVERSENGSSFIPIAEVGIDNVFYADIGLNPGTGYYYRVRARNVGPTETFYSTYSNTVSDATPMTPIIANPTGLAAAAQMYYQIDLSWQDNADNETGYVIERSVNGVDFLTTINIGPDSNSYSDTGLSRGATYYYRIRAERIEPDNTFYSDYSVIVSASTMPGPSTPAPTNLQLVFSELNRIDIQWEDNSTSETEYLVERSEDGVNFINIAILGPDSTLYPDLSVTQGVTYRYRVRTRTEENGSSFYSSYSNVLTVVSSDTPPLMPSFFRVYTNANVPQTIRAQWTDEADNEIGFIIERSVDEVNFEELARLPANTIDYQNTDSIYVPYHYYTFRIKAYNNSGESDWSTYVMRFTPKY